MAKLTALITGASTGIGYELAKLLAADGFDLLLAARGADRLRAVADEVSADNDIEATVYVADLSVRGAAADLYGRITDDGHVVDVLANNAGFGSYGSFHEIDPDRYAEMLELNVVALTALARLAIADMMARGAGRILNVASTAAFQAGPLMAAYYASKAYVLSL
ncbi:SDR family NAD(P)-dependent oxidoreductase, partial [Candidatus Poribacteria bacterium]|nr:SDR family NAD(P)-dependent oxidoreductase [Candidatus Poribacteria bacterium]